MKPISLAAFFQEIGQIMQETENIGAEMNPYYEEIQAAAQSDDIKIEVVAKVHTAFEEGVEQYNKIEQKVFALRSPAKLVILFQQFQNAYKQYVRGCQMMLEAVDPEVGYNDELFQKAEQLQDKKSRELAKIMTKMMRFIR